MNNYHKQVELLISVLPEIAKEKIFALHGGTAINLFDNNLPRLSVDIDLTYLPIENREDSLNHINTALISIQKRIERYLAPIRIQHKAKIGKLLIQKNNTQIKIEVNLVKRGCYLPPKNMELCLQAQDIFDAFCTMPIVEKGHLYGGKICAALDRQHPRDIFDVHHLFKNEGFSDRIKKGFIFYLISAGRPSYELLFPHLLDQSTSFESQFKGMTNSGFSYDDFISTRKELIQTIQKTLTKDDLAFILSIEKGQPNWELYNFKGFPAIKWKLKNLESLKNENPKKYLEHIQKHEKLLIAN